MKKIIIPMLSVLFFAFISCYNGSRDAIVRINLGNIPLARKAENKPFADKIFSLFVKNAYAQVLPQDLGVIKIHIAAYNGSKLISKDSLDTTGMTTNIVEFNVPAGDNITILVVGENNSNLAGYYGYTSANLASGETSDVTINMSIPAWVVGTTGLFISTFSCSGTEITWAPSGVKTKYLIQENVGSVAPVWSTLYEDYGTSLPLSITYRELQFIVEFEDFNLQTQPLIFYNGCG